MLNYTKCTLQKVKQGETRPLNTTSTETSEPFSFKHSALISLQGIIKYNPVKRQHCSHRVPLESVSFCGPESAFSHFRAMLASELAVLVMHFFSPGFIPHPICLSVMQQEHFMTSARLSLSLSLLLQALMENSNLNFVKPAWIYAINERQKMLPYQPYTVVP